MELTKPLRTIIKSENKIMHTSKRIIQESKQREIKRSNGILKCAWDLARLFGKRTSIHGVNRLLGNTAGPFERVVWFFTVVLAFAGSIYVCLILSHRFREGRFQTVVDSTRMPVYKIHFPVITICNLNRLNWARIEEAKHWFLPNETSTEKLELFERILGTFDDIGFARFEEFAILEGQPLELLNHINFSLVVDFMTWRCEELLEDCKWREKKMNCCEIFSKRRTKNGLCWAFNTLENDEGRRMQLLDPMWPWHTGGFGPGSALKVRALINPEKHYPNRINEKGLRVMVTEPNVWHRDFLYISENTEAQITIDPEITFLDEDTKSVSSDQRKCVFEDERASPDFKSLQNYIYMFENCQAECHQEHMMHYCNCSMDLLFPPGQYPSCRTKDLLCLGRYNDHFFHTFVPGEEQYVRNEPKGMECLCYVNCYSINYYPHLHSRPLTPEIRKNRSYVVLDAYYRFEVMIVYRTSLVFGWLDLLVAFGGIAGLFLGCSVISGIELLYFAFIETPNFILKRNKCNGGKQVQSQNTNAAFSQ